MKSKGPRLRHLALEALQRLFADEAVPLAGNIAFRTVFSLFPFLIFLTALGGFFGNEVLAEQIVTYLLSIWPEQLVRPLATEIRSILTVPRTGLLSIAAILTVWSASAGVDSIRVGLNRAYDAVETRSMVMLYVQSAVFVVGAAAVLLVLGFLLVLAPVGIALIEAYAPALRGHFATLEQLRYPVAIVLLFLALQLAHRVLPARRLSALEVLPGVALTVLVWIALASAFSFYLVRFNTFASTYASLSGLFGMMFFIYLSALVLILGGELNRVLMVRRMARSNAAKK